MNHLRPQKGLRMGFLSSLFILTFYSHFFSHSLSSLFIFTFYPHFLSSLFLLTFNPHFLSSFFLLNFYPHFFSSLFLLSFSYNFFSSLFLLFCPCACMLWARIQTYSTACSKSYTYYLIVQSIVCHPFWDKYKNKGGLKSCAQALLCHGNLSLLIRLRDLLTSVECWKWCWNQICGFS